MTREQERIFAELREALAELKVICKRGDRIAECGPSQRLLSEARAALWTISERLRALEYDLDPTPWPFVESAKEE